MSDGASDVKFYNEHVRNVFVQNCYKCHTEEAMGGLRLDSHDAILKGGDSGPAVVPHSPDTSILIKAVQQTGSLKMPPKSKLSDSEIADLVTWVKNGAVGDPNEDAKPVVAGLTAEQAKARLATSSSR